MAFQVPASKASIGQDQFTFHIGDEAFSVKKAKFLKVGQLEALEQSTAASIDYFGKAGTRQGDLIRELDRDQFEALLEAWRDDSEVKPGESRASAT